MNLDRELEGAEDATAFDRAFNYSVRSSISYAPNLRCYFYVELFVRQRGAYYLLIVTSHYLGV